VVAKPPSAEALRRAQDLLKQLEFPIGSPSLLRQVRTIEILDSLGTPESRELLKDLARGAADAQLTQAARAALAGQGER
jgi:hypothetical protein